MRFQCFLLLAGLALMVGPSVSPGQIRLRGGAGLGTTSLNLRLNALAGGGIVLQPAQLPAPPQQSQVTPQRADQPPAGRRGRDPGPEAEAAFRQMDANGDGLLSYDEMDEALRAERHKWDTNQDGFIDLDEFKEYYKARTRQERADDPRGRSKRRAAADALGLPPGLPDWFFEYDTDGDGQIGLYEWRAARQPIGRFLAMDQNRDGFLTPDEVLWALSH